MVWNVTWRVVVDGNDVTFKMRPTLISISVQDKDGTASDSCKLVFDDTRGQSKLPREDAYLVVFLQGTRVFEGTVDKVRSKGSRSGGRTISVSAKGFDTKGKVKDGQRWHKDNATLKDALSHSAKKAGLSGVKIDPEFASIKRNYWSPDGASFLAWGQALAEEHHATFKIRGKKAVFAKRGGSVLSSVTGIVGKNVISWDISPKSGRRKFKKATAQYFDRKKAKFETEVTNVGAENADGTNAARATLADKSQAKESGKARKSEAKRESGGGKVSLDLSPNAQAEAPFILSGARSGVDGQYRIVSVTHKANRGGGSTTDLALKEPSPT